MPTWAVTPLTVPFATFRVALSPRRDFIVLLGAPQVVLPLPGHSIIFPANKVAEVYTKRAADDGISLDSSPHGCATCVIIMWLCGAPGRAASPCPCDCVRGSCSMGAAQRLSCACALVWAPACRVKEFSMMYLSGDYRPLLQRPSTFAWRFVPYCNPNADIDISDADEADEQQLAVTVTEPAPPEAPAGEAEPEAAGGRQLRALALRFILPASAYATMLIRELTKEDSSTAHHRGLSAVAQA